MPEVSVIIPAYNRESSVVPALRSALGQTLDDIEIIVVDDGSTDNTRGVVAGVGDPRVRCISNDANTGPAMARNRGLDAASGEFVAFLDSDDSWNPEKLERQLACFEKATDDVQAVCCAFRVRHAGSGRVVERHPDKNESRVRKMLDVCSVAPGTTMLARRTVFSDIGNQEPGLRQFEDWDWLIRYLRKYTLLVMDDVLATVSMHKGPAPESVKRQTERLFALRRRDVAEQFGKRGLNRFHASMHIEYAVACVRSGRYMNGAAAVMRAALLSPARVFDLAKRAGVKIFSRDY